MSARSRQALLSRSGAVVIYLLVLGCVAFGGYWSVAEVPISATSVPVLEEERPESSSEASEEKAEADVARDPWAGDPSTWPLHFTGEMTRPEIIHQVEPVYTKVAFRARVEGTSILQLVIDEEGNVIHARILRGLPLGLDKAAIEAVEQWRFKPATLEGRPVKVAYNVQVTFRVPR